MATVGVKGLMVVVVVLVGRPTVGRPRWRSARRCRDSLWRCSLPCRSTRRQSVHTRSELIYWI